MMAIKPSLFYNMHEFSSDSGQIFDRIRHSCRRVARRATRVRINYRRISSYAAELPVERVARPRLDPDCHYLGRQEDTVSFLLTLNAINFGSGYFPHLRKRPGKSGYFTMAYALNDAYQRQGPLSARQLADMTGEECTLIFNQDPDNPVARELMQHFARALNDLGRFILGQFNGSFTALVESAAASAGCLVQLLTKMPYYNDVGLYKGIEVQFFKRAQISAADLSLAFDRVGWGLFEDLDQMTIFADNLVPHVLRLDDILIYEKSLVGRINDGLLIPAGSTEEIEIRACAVHAVELIKMQLAESGNRITSPDLDNFLWNRGQQPDYKAKPRHRTRCVYY
jgi:hypothetical protein